jgi:hypothetical protein
LKHVLVREPAVVVEYDEDISSSIIGPAVYRPPLGKYAFNETHFEILKCLRIDAFQQLGNAPVPVTVFGRNYDGNSRGDVLYIGGSGTHRFIIILKFVRTGIVESLYNRQMIRKFQ